MRLTEAQSLLREGRLAEAERAYECVLEQTPENVEALNVVGLAASRRGEQQRARELLGRATTIDPADARSWHHLGRIEDVAGNFPQAEAAYRQALDLAPAMSQGHFLLGWALMARREPTSALAEMEQETDDRYRDVGRALALDALGRKAEADRALAVAKAKYAGVVEYPIAVFYANRNDLDEAFAWLDHAYKLHDGWVPWVPWDPLLKNLRGDPRYKAFLRKMNLPE